MYITKVDLDTINKIVEENNLERVKLIQDNSSGIGSILDLEYETDINGRKATVRIPVSGIESW
jgi:hypothetical protein